MDTIAEQRRNIIPRWRDFKTTLRLGELRSTERLSDDEIDESVEEQLLAWEANKSLSFATDLVGAGLILGQSERIQEAIDFILSPQSESTDLQRRIAKRASNASWPCSDANPEITTTSSHELIDKSEELVRRFRRELREAPRDPVKQVELSRQYAILGSREKAIRAMDVALALAPNNRFVLRSAARLFVHVLEFERAHHILKRARSLRRDPWLLAAEIGVSSLMEKSSAHTKVGMVALEDDNFSYFETSELASALATLEMTNANYKLARKLFAKALTTPTENSVAQAEWASREVGHLSVRVEDLNVPRKYEALTLSHFNEGRFDEAVGAGKNWILDQPFAVTPVLFTGLVANIIEDFDLSEKIYSFGLAANPTNACLRNNLAFALASKNDPKAAELELDRIDRAALNVQSRIAIMATEGLIEFRKGNDLQGRALYRRAIQIAEDNKEQAYAMRALVYLAREELLSGTEVAVPTLENAEVEFRKFTSKELETLLKRLREIAQSKYPLLNSSDGPKRIATALSQGAQSD
jgi:tetratricopeptide (TPR) repeat protein